MVRCQSPGLKWGAGEFNRPIGLLDWPPMSGPDRRSANRALVLAAERELFRHARVRQTKRLALAQKQAG
jgi:hypothetical protein